MTLVACSVLIASLCSPPALGLAFVPLGSRGGRVQMGKLRLDFNMYTGPGYLGALLGVANIVLLVLIFRERKLKRGEKEQGGEKMKKMISGKLPPIRHNRKHVDFLLNRIIHQ